MKVQNKVVRLLPTGKAKEKGFKKKYGEELVQKGYAYYAFDTPEDLDLMRMQLRTAENPNPQYDRTIRMQMRNSLSLSKEEVSDLLQKQIPHVIRVKMPEAEFVSFTDLIRGEVNFDTSTV